MVERLFVMTEYFMSRQSEAKWRGFVLRQGISCCNRAWSWEEVPMSLPNILGRN